MYREEYKKTEEGLSERVGNPKTSDFEEEQNLFGLFQLLLEEDRRVNPQNYKN